MKEVYDNYDFLRRLTEKRFSDAILADEAYTFAFEGLMQDDWRRVKAYRGESSFRGYLGRVWCRLLEDFRIKKYGKVTPPQWVKNLGGVWGELFNMLCRRRLNMAESIEIIIDSGTCELDNKTLEKTAIEILEKIPSCGKNLGPAFSIDNDEEDTFCSLNLSDDESIPEKMTIEKEKWTALQALAGVCFKSSGCNTKYGVDQQKLAALVSTIRERLSLSTEEQLILTLHFVDGESISAIGKFLGLNSNQVHGKYKRLIIRIRKTLSDLLEPYI